MVFVENDKAVHQAIIFFHGNAEDATTSIDLMIELNDNLDVRLAILLSFFLSLVAFELFCLSLSTICSKQTQ